MAGGSRGRSTKLGLLVAAAAAVLGAAVLAAATGCSAPPPESLFAPTRVAEPTVSPSRGAASPKATPVPGAGGAAAPTRAGPTRPAPPPGSGAATIRDPQPLLPRLADLRPGWAVATEQHEPGLASISFTRPSGPGEAPGVLTADAQVAASTDEALRAWPRFASTSHLDPAPAALLGDASVVATAERGGTAIAFVAVRVDTILLRLYLGLPGSEPPMDAAVSLMRDMIERARAR